MPSSCLSSSCWSDDDVLDVGLVNLSGIQTGVFSPSFFGGARAPGSRHHLSHSASTMKTQVPMEF